MLECTKQKRERQADLALVVSSAFASLAHFTGRECWEVEAGGKACTNV